MGFLDGLFDKEKKEQKRYKKLEKTLTHMYVQPAERNAVIYQLTEMETPEAVRILLTRYRENSHNTTVDLEEKELVYDKLVMLGKQPNDLDVVGITKTYLGKIDGHVNWPLRVLTDLVSYEEFADVLVDLLSNCTTDYKQNPEKKQELLLRSQEFKSPAIAQEVTRFLEDLNETVRFYTVDAMLAQEMNDESIALLVDLLAEEESLRIVQKVCDAFNNNHSWHIPDDRREAVADAIPDDFGVHNGGHIYKRR